jgi:hypothetical protein
MRAALVAVLAAACGSGGTAMDNTLAYCVDQVNDVRTDAGLAALTRSPDVEAYAAAGAAIDGSSRIPHKHFTDTLDAGVAAAELEIPQFSFRAWGGVEGVIAEGVREQSVSPSARMTLVGDYTQLGCGIYQDGDEVTVVEDFR